MKQINKVKIEELKVGDIYRIPDVLDILKKDPEMKIGHGVIMGEHVYFLGYEDLKNIYERIKEAGPTLITRTKDINDSIKILSVIDPKKELRDKYMRFCSTIEPNISAELKRRPRGIATTIESLRDMAIEFEDLWVKDNKEFIEGLNACLSVKGINAKPIGVGYVAFSYILE